MSIPVLWLLITAALVLFMTPGLAFFYGGLVKAKSVISMMMLSFGSIGLVGVLWVLFGFNQAFVDGTSETDWIPEVLGNPFSDFGLQDAATAAFSGDAAAGSVLAGAIFGATFAIITVALISGSIADRARFWPWMLFVGLFATLVYFPVASWVFAFVVNEDGTATFTGWVGQLGAHLGYDTSTIDFAGGTAVHINAGAAALAAQRATGAPRRAAVGRPAILAHVPESGRHLWPEACTGTVSLAGHAPDRPVSLRTQGCRPDP